MLLPFLYLRYIQRPMGRGHLWRPYPVASLQACTHTMGNCLPATSTLIPVKCLPFQPQSLHRTQWDRNHCPHCTDEKTESGQWLTQDHTAHRRNQIHQGLSPTSSLPPPSSALHPPLRPAKPFANINGSSSCMWGACHPSGTELHALQPMSHFVSFILYGTFCTAQVMHYLVTENWGMQRKI